MANIYVRSTDGSDADNGSTWALAKATLTGAAAIDAAGDNIYVSQSHAESTAAVTTIAFAGSAATPVRVICVNDSAEPPTAEASGATVSTTGASNLLISGTGTLIKGFTFTAGQSTDNASIRVNTVDGTWDSCTLRCGGSSTSARIALNGGNNTTSTFKNVFLRFAAAAQGLTFLSNQCWLTWDGGGLASGGTSPNNLILLAASSRRVALSGLDLSAGGSGMNIFSGGAAGIQGGTIRNSRLPASWSGSLCPSTLTATERYELYNCDSGDTNYRLQIIDYAGSMLDETTIVRTGGASDGTTPISWKMVSGANAEYPHIPLASPEIVRWNETTGSSITVTVEVITDNVTLTDAECWIEVQYLGTSGFPLGTFISDAKADVVATAANQTTSSETWTTTGLGTPVKQKLAVTFTPQEKGFIHAVVKLAKASTTVYVDPLLTVT